MRYFTCSECSTVAEYPASPGRPRETCSMRCARTRRTRRQNEDRAARRRAREDAEHRSWLVQMLADGDLATAEVLEDAGMLRR